MPNFWFARKLEEIYHGDLDNLADAVAVVVQELLVVISPKEPLHFQSMAKKLNFRCMHYLSSNGCSALALIYTSTYAQTITYYHGYLSTLENTHCVQPCPTVSGYLQ